MMNEEVYDESTILSAIGTGRVRDTYLKVSK